MINTVDIFDTIREIEKTCHTRDCVTCMDCECQHDGICVCDVLREVTNYEIILTDSTISDDLAGPIARLGAIDSEVASQLTKIRDSLKERGL